jgi:hypothetical protein
MTSSRTAIVFLPFTPISGPSFSAGAIRDSISSAPTGQCNTPIPSKQDVASVLSYFVNDWMPSDHQTSPRCQVAGFAPIWHDEKVGANILREAIQACKAGDSLSIHALLAVSACRAQTLDGIIRPDSTLPA